MDGPGYPKLARHYHAACRQDKTGESLPISVRPELIHLFDGETGRRLAG